MSTDDLTEQQGNTGIPVVQRIASILWPSFIMSGIATGLFFTVFDPLELTLLTGHADISRMAVYSSGFFTFWLLTSSTSALTCYFRRPCDHVKEHR